MERVAILPFENLTGDPSLDWIRQAGPAILSDEIVGAPHVLPIRSPDMNEAGFAGATRLLHCSVTWNNPGSRQALHLSFALEDAARHKMAGTGAADGSILFAIDALARTLDPSAQPFSSHRADAIAAWGQGDFERAITLDPDFGAAWTNWTEQLARAGKPDQALLVADKGLARASLRSPLDRARLQLVAAGLRKDENARVTALTALVGLAPADSGTVLALAQAEQNQRRFAESAEQYRRVLAMEPGNAGAMNALGYAEGEAGNLDAAVQALQRYGQQGNQGVNALDSLGEVHFMNGHFAEAEKYFLQVNARDPGFLQGVDIMKAAYAHWLAGFSSNSASGGNIGEADALMRRYLDFRAQQGDRDVILRDAAWLFSTGRSKEAAARLAAVPADQKAIAARQLGVWRGEVKLPADLNQLKNAYEATNPAADGLIRTIYAAALLAAGRPDQARALLTRWPLPQSAGDPLLQSLVFPEFLELRQKVGIR